LAVQRPIETIAEKPVIESRLTRPRTILQLTTTPDEAAAAGGNATRPPVHVELKSITLPVLLVTVYVFTW
jgi:hypothetical protein